MRRWIVMLLVFLLAGAVVNVAVAWAAACAARERPMQVTTTRGWQTHPRSGLPWMIREGRSPGCLLVVRGRGEAVLSFPAGEPRAEPDPPAWAASAVWHVGDHAVLAAAVAWGWPRRALWYDICIWNDVLNTSGLRAPMPGSPGCDLHRDGLRVHPIWSGFVINTIFYAAVLWLLIPGPFVLRRFIRRLRELCPGCGYPMGESDVCSECGMALPGHTEAAK